jgi:serine phosphatase RsbU (regulator of sigma subunit)
MIVGEVRPGPFLDSLHRSMLDLLEHTILFATFAVLRIDLAACSIEYATAGHPPQLLLHSRQAVEELMTPNCALGMELTALSPKILVGKTTFETGDTLLLFTDGLFEAREPGTRGTGRRHLRSSRGCRRATPGRRVPLALRRVRPRHCARPRARFEDVRAKAGRRRR